MHAPEESLLDAIALSIACDGEVNEDEVTRAVRIVRELPLFQGRDIEELESIVGEAFERFASEGKSARISALASAKLDTEARLEILTTAALVMQGGKPQEAFTIELAHAIGATEEERKKVVELVSRVRGSPT